MSNIDGKIGKAATQYATMQNTLPGYDPAIRKAYIEGANWALSHQWRSVEKDGLPEIGQRVIICYRIKNPKTSVWFNSFISDKYDGAYMPDNSICWMPIPPLPEAGKEGEE